MLLTLAGHVPGAYGADKATKENAPVASKEEPGEEKEGFAGSYLSSQFAKDSGDIGGAIRYLERVYADRPGSMELARQLQGMYLLEGRIGDALKLADTIHKADKKDALSNLLLCLKAINDKNTQKAVEFLESSGDQGRVQLWEPLITAWLDVENQHMDKALMIDQLNIDASRIMPLVNYHMALINSQAGFKNEAAENFKKAVENPKDPPERIMAQMLTFYDSNEKPEALTPLIEAYRQSHPDNQASMPLITTARDGISEILYTMGSIMLTADMANDAAIYEQLALYIKSDFPEAELTLADSYSELQQFDKANVYYDKIDPKSVYYKKAQLHIAINDERTGKLDQALKTLDGLDKHYPSDLEALVTKADLLRIHSKFPEAVDSYTAAISRIKDPKPLYWPVYFARGSCYERMNRWDDAEADLQKALELKPDQPDVLNYLGYGWLERGKNIEKARQMIQTAFKARPDDAEIVDSMGWSLYLGGDYVNAARYLEKAVDLLPGDATVNEHLGDAYWRVGRKTEARFQWERSLSFTTDEKLTTRIGQKLKEGLPASDAANVKVESQSSENLPAPDMAHTAN